MFQKIFRGYLVYIPKRISFRSKLKVIICFFSHLLIEMDKYIDLNITKLVTLALHSHIL